MQLEHLLENILSLLYYIRSIPVCQASVVLDLTTGLSSSMGYTNPQPMSRILCLYPSVANCSSRL